MPVITEDIAFGSITAVGSIKGSVTSPTSGQTAIDEIPTFSLAVDFTGRLNSQIPVIEGHIYNLYKYLLEDTRVPIGTDEHVFNFIKKPLSL